MSDDQPVTDTKPPSAAVLKVYMDAYIESLVDQARYPCECESGLPSITAPDIEAAANQARQPDNTRRFYYAENYLARLSAVQTKCLLYRILTADDDDPALNRICSAAELEDAKIRGITEPPAMMGQKAERSPPHE